MSSPRRRVPEYLEHPITSEVMVFNPDTCKLEIKRRADAERQQHEAAESQQPRHYAADTPRQRHGAVDRPREVMIDMNREGAGGFYFL